MTESESHHSHHEHEHRMEQDRSGLKAMLAYGRHIPDFWRSDVNRAVVEIIEPQPGETILDIGAGMGAAVLPAAALVGSHGRVIAIEPTLFMRRMLAGRCLLNRRRQTIKILDGIAENLDVDAESIDAALSVNTLHHVSDLTAMAEELHRVLRPGGRVLLLDEDFDDESHPQYESLEDAKRGHRFGFSGGDHHHGTDDHGHTHLEVDIDKLGETMRRIGFIDIVAGHTTVAGAPVRAG